MAAFMALKFRSTFTNSYSIGSVFNFMTFPRLRIAVRVYSHEISWFPLSTECETLISFWLSRMLLSTNRFFLCAWEMSELLIRWLLGHYFVKNERVLKLITFRFWTCQFICFWAFFTRNVGNKNEPEDVTSMEECALLYIQDFERYAFDACSMRSSTLRSFICAHFFSRRFLSSIVWLAEKKRESNGSGQAAKVKVFVDMLSSHSSANSRTYKRR